MSVHTGRKTAEDESPLAQLETSKQKVNEVIGRYGKLMRAIELMRDSGSLPKEGKEVERLERLLGTTKVLNRIMEGDVERLAEQIDLTEWVMEQLAA